MIGEHTVTVSSDRSADAWGLPANTNPYFDTDAAGWTVFGGGTWNGGRIINASSVQTTNAALVPYTAGALRARVALTVDAVRRLALNVRYYDAANNVLGGVAPNRTFDPGTWSWDYNVPTTPPPAGTVKVGVSLNTTTAGQLIAAINSFELFHYDPANAPADISCLVDEVSVQHGRDDPTGQPDASTATVNMSWDADDDVFPAEAELGAVLTVYTTYPAVGGDTFTRFIGRVTDISFGWDEAGEETPSRPVAQLVCAGFLADLGRRVVGDTPFPQELDGARVSRVFGLAGVVLDPFTSDPGTVQIQPRDIDSQSAMDVALSVADSAGGIVWSTRDGYVRYADAEHRRGLVASLSLDACDVLVTPTWQRTTEGLVNSVSIGYGVTPEGGEQPRYVAQNQASIDKYGLYALTDTTELAASADAAARGSLALTRNAEPVWVMAALPVDLAHLDAARTAALLALDMHALVNLTGLPSVGAAPTSAVLWLEGWSERLAFGEHEIELHVSGYCRTAPPPRWDDLDPTWTWDTVTPASLTWDQTTCFGPPTSSGRWSDVPASLRWDQVPGTTTWDTWK